MPMKELTILKNWGLIPNPWANMWCQNSLGRAIKFVIYSLYKKKRKHYIIFNILRTFKDEHFKLTGDLDWHVPYQ